MHEIISSFSTDTGFNDSVVHAFVCRHISLSFPIFQSVFERQRDEWAKIVKLKPSCSAITIC